MIKKTVPIVGMACSACSAHVEKTLRELDGVSSVSVSLPGRSALLEYDPERISLLSMKQALNDVGFDMVIEEGQSSEEIERREYVLLRRKTMLSWLLALLTMAVSMGWLPVGSSDTVHQVCLLLALANILFCGRSFYANAWKRLRHGVADMDALVMLSTAITFLFSAFNTFWGSRVWGSRGMEWHVWFDASVMIITFVLTGRLLEEYAKRGTADSIRQLMGLAPKTARIVDQPQPPSNIPATPSEASSTPASTLVPLSTVAIGDILEVRAGEKIPVDGLVTWADCFMTPDGAYVDEAMITGEPTPVLKQRGATVLAGTMVKQGQLRFRAKQVGEQTALAGIIRMVQEAQGSKAPVQRSIDKMAMIFVPTVAALSLVTFLLWWILGGYAALPHAILSAVAVLVIACPCAMGLATPTALMVGIGKAAQKQILIKDATALEQLRNIDAVVTDKTGTLTIPNQQVDFTKADSLPLEQRETLKPHAREAMTQLRQMGVDVYLMSGDKEEAVAYWADKAGIAHYYSKVLPGDKEKLVGRLQGEGRHVAMIGDGINDTQALARADVSIAMGRGTDVAMDVAQVTLMGDDLWRIPEAMVLSRQTVSMIHQNLFWAFAYNVVCIPLAAGLPYAFGIPFQITPMWGSALMAFSSVSVVLNSLRLRWKG